MRADNIKNGEEAMDAYIKELHTMEHIGNYLNKYRHMIAEYDEAKKVENAVDALETALREQGRQITDVYLMTKDAVERLEALEKEFEDYKLIEE